MFRLLWLYIALLLPALLTNAQELSRDTLPGNPLTLDGKPQEEHGHVLGGTLAWSGNYLLKADVKNTSLTISAGINEEMAHYVAERRI